MVEQAQAIVLMNRRLAAAEAIAARLQVGPALGGEPLAPEGVPGPARSERDLAELRRRLRNAENRAAELELEHAQLGVEMQAATARVAELTARSTPGTEPGSPGNRLSTGGRAVLAALRKFPPSADFVLGEPLAREQFSVLGGLLALPDDELVLAAVWRNTSRREAMLFGQQAIYYHSRYDTGVLPYTELALLEVKRTRRWHVELGNGDAFNVAGSSVSAKELVAMLDAVRAVFGASGGPLASSAADGGAK